jgi:hypothetical protein
VNTVPFSNENCNYISAFKETLGSNIYISMTILAYNDMGPVATKNKNNDYINTV